MGQVGFGQPDDGIIQMAYVVPNLRAAISEWTTKLRVGPWFVLEHFTGIDPVYREMIERRGYGFHHWGLATWNFDAAVAQYERAGYALAFRAAVPSGGRVGYMDTTAVLPGYTELIELGGAFEEVFGRFYRASRGWDGKDPIRSFI